MLLLSACRSDEEKLVDLRTDLRTRMDELYSAYGGSGLATQARAELERPDAADEGHDTAARLVGELDRSYFEGFCLARGRGERPFVLSSKLDAFVKAGENEKACRDAAKIAARISELEAKSQR
jgi:hypothetical protein